MSLLERVEAALDTIRPYLLIDAGNVSVEEITPENVVRLRLLGSCGSCPMSIMTLKAGIEEAIQAAQFHKQLLHINLRKWQHF